MSTLLLSHADLQRVVQRVGIDAFMDEMISRLDAALSDFDPEVTEIPIRDGFHYESPVTGLIEWMPLLEKHKSVVIKVVGYHPDSPDTLQLPTILSNLSKYDPATGRLLALVDGTFLTAMRTGAVSAVASRVLADPGSTTVGLIGCGAQAVTQLHALTRCFPVTDVLIRDADGAAMNSFPDRIRAYATPGVRIREARVGEIVATADILCVATSVGIGHGPVFTELNTKPTLHVNAVGSDFPGKLELPKQLLLDSYVCPDTLEQAMREGECQQLAREQVGVDLVTLIQNREDFYQYQAANTVFDSTGWALEDQVAMELILEYANAFQIGTQVQIECVSVDPRDPYEFLHDDAADDANNSHVPIGGVA